ncbi:MAG TPA: efflux RND transporter permease subunit [Candidatus Acidoferrales bacterium]|nr:efflux RND transporter permease subunit [Candidatus Acidoferrales bacterium]
MSVTELFIRRPVMTSLVMLAILAFGILGYRDLAVSDLPNVDFPTIQVSASLPGASPETMGSAVATPLEKQFTTIAGLDSMTSTSSLGNTSITLQFNLNRSIDSAALDVQAAITSASNQLPPNMPSPPTFRKVNPADSPVLFLALTSATLPVSEVDEYAETLLGEQISMVPGVAQVGVFGSMKYAVRVEANPEELASRRIGIDELAQAIQNANVNMPMGTLYGQHKAFNIQSNGQLTDAAKYRPMIVAYRNGAPVRLDQVATVLDSVQDDKVMNWINAEPGIILAVQRQPGSNTIDIVNAVRSLLPRFRSIMPPAMHLAVEYDKSISIQESVSDVKFTLFLAIVLVVLVIFLFLRNASATLIPSLALPMAIIGTFAVMYLLDYTVDNLSLLALTLSVGFVVDDAIVMLENIVRHMEMGKGVLEAALDGSKEIGFTIVSMTLALAAVFLPVFFMGGILGRLLHEFAVVIISAVLVSGLVSLTLTPMLCSRYLRAQHGLKHGWFYRKLEGILDTSLRWYGLTLRWALSHRGLVMLFGLLTLFGTAWEFWIIPKGFLPEEDSSEVVIFTEANQGISFDAMMAHQQAVNKIILDDPNTLEFFSNISDSNSDGLNNGRAYVHLKEPKDRPWTDNSEYDHLVAQFGHTPVLGSLVGFIRPIFERHMSIQDITDELQPKLNRIPGVRVFLQNPPAIRIGGHLTKSQYQFTLSSPDQDALYKFSQLMESKLKQLPDLADVTTDLQIKNPQANVMVDRDQASALGVTPEQVENALYSAYGQRQISTIYTPNNEYWVILQVQDKFQSDPNMLNDLYIRSSGGQLIPLSAVSKFTTSLGPLTVNHTGQLPSVTISFDLPPGVALGQAVNDVQNAAKILPISISTSFQGSAQAFQQSLTGLGLLLITAVLVIYLVLGILYESYVHPITILTGLPAAVFGGLATLSLFHMQLDIYGFVGLIMLIGIVKKNAIMVVDFSLEHQRATGDSASEAAYQGSIIRFRPIMMTTAAAIMGTLPIAIGFGAGANSRRPLGLCVVGGLIFAQLVTLFVTPVFYTYMDVFLSWRRKSRGRAHEPAGEPDAAHEAAVAHRTQIGSHPQHLTHD